MTTRQPGARPSHRRRPGSLVAAVAIALGVSALLLAAPAQAQRGEIHVGAGFGIASVEVRSSGAFDQILDGDENVVFYNAGYRFHPNFAIEASWYDLSQVDGSILPCTRGETCDEVDITGDFSAWSFALVPRYQFVGRVAVFGKVGLVAWDSTVDRRDALDDISFEDLDEGNVMYGVGVEVRLLSSLSAVGAWESLGGDIEIISAGLRLTF